MTSTNGIHIGWESLPPLQNPDTLKEQAVNSTEEEVVCMPPKMMRCQEKTLFTDQDYEKMENEIKYGKYDPTSMDIDDWDIPLKLEEDRKRREQSKKVAYL
jgi:hypothetical protein